MSQASLAAADWWRRSHAARQRGLMLLGLACLASFLLSIAIGATDVGIGQFVAWLWSLLPLGGEAPPAGAQAVLLQIRLPRALAAAAVGAALGISGATVQGLFRNPLADPGLIGISGGASLAAVAVIVLGGSLRNLLPEVLHPFLLPLAAFAGSIVATLLVYRIAALRDDLGIAALLLAGIAINAIAMAGVGVFIFMSNDDQLRSLNFWMLGSVGATTWHTLLPALALMLPAAILLPRLARALDLFSMGERQAWLSGIDTDRLRRRAVILVALAVGAAVAISGTIGFVGLVVPHLVRLMLGPDHRGVLAGSALLGAALLGGADILARTLVMPAELPIGLVTALVGGPFFLWLLLRRRGGAV
mgnify:CR=1 FL=1|jgi:iron complex transport system permease protein